MLRNWLLHSILRCLLKCPNIAYTQVGYVVISPDGGDGDVELLGDGLEGGAARHAVGRLAQQALAASDALADAAVGGGRGGCGGCGGRGGCAGGGRALGDGDDVDGGHDARRQRHQPAAHLHERARRRRLRRECH